MATVERQQVFLDIELADEPIGRIVIELFNDIVPKTAKNFYCLCTGLFVSSFYFFVPDSLAPSLIFDL